MLIFEQEKDIADLILSSKASTSVSVDIDESDLTTVLDDGATEETSISRLVQSMRPKYIAKHSFWMPAVLVSAGPNKNDDYFTPEELWKARHTPVNKPVNWQHNGEESSKKNEIIGVINNSTPVDKGFEPASDPAALASIAIGMFVWSSYFPTYAGKITRGQEEGKLFVSMETLFPNFNYVLKNIVTGEETFVKRDEKTAGLSRYLKAFKGPGVIKVPSGTTYRIYRQLEDLDFTAVGFVDRPANDKSILLDSPQYSVAASAMSKASAEFIEMLENSVLNNISEKGDQMAETNSTANVATASAEDFAQVKAQYDALAAQMKDMQAKCEQAEASAQAMKVKCEEATASQKDMQAKCEQAQAELAQAKQSSQDWQTKCSALESAVAGFTKDKVMAARAAKIQTAGIKDAGVISKLQSLDEPSFEAAFAAVTSFTTAATDTVTSLPNAATDTVTSNANAAKAAEVVADEVTLESDTSKVDMAKASATPAVKSIDLAKEQLTKLFSK